MAIKIKNNFDSLMKDLSANLTEAMTDIILDVGRVSSAAAPHKTGKLEKSYTSTVDKIADGISASITYKATNDDGNNYAVDMHENNYKLGELSKRKSPAKSKFSSESIPVGKGYLKNTIEKGQKGYTEHLQQVMNDAIKKNEV